MGNNASSARRVALCGLLTALMLVLGYLESRIPVLPGVPGVKLGLSNAVLLYAAYMLPVPVTYGLMVVKVLLSGLLFGNPAAMAFSFAGGLLSVSGMLLCKRCFGVLAVSVISAVLHNVGQVLVAMFLLGTTDLIYYLAVLTLIAIGTGLLTGTVAGLVMKHLKHAKF